MALEVLCLPETLLLAVPPLLHEPAAAPLVGRQDGAKHLLGGGGTVVERPFPPSARLLCRQYERLGSQPSERGCAGYLQLSLLPLSWRCFATSDGARTAAVEWTGTWYPQTEADGLGFVCLYWSVPGRFFICLLQPPITAVAERRGGNMHVPTTTTSLQTLSPVHRLAEGHASSTPLTAPLAKKNTPRPYKGP